MVCVFIPFYSTMDDEFNEVHIFTVKSSNPKVKKPYIVKITIDGMNDSLLVNKECTCVAGYYKPSINGQCKHIKESLELLKVHGITFREQITTKNELPDEKKTEPDTTESD